MFNDSSERAEPGDPHADEEADTQENPKVRIVEIPQDWERIIENCSHDIVRYHEYFEADIIKKKQQEEGDDVTYHNAQHVLGFVKAGDSIFEAFENGKDPFELQGQVDAYNQKLAAERGLDLDTLAEDQQISLVDLKIALELLIGHDTGNITREPGTETDANGTLKLTYADIYQGDAPATEHRSARICLANLEVRVREYATLFPEHDQEIFVKIFERQKKLLEYLTLLTVFNPKEGEVEHGTKPFWKLIQTIDQVGASRFSEQNEDENVAGLLNELSQRGIPIPEEHNLRFFQDFENIRFPMIESSSEKRRMIIDIFEQAQKSGDRSHNWEKAKLIVRREAARRLQRNNK